MKFKIKIITTLLCLLFSSSLVFSQQPSSVINYDRNPKFIEPKDPYPTVDIKIIKDNNSGYNVQIITKNFRFTPDKIGTTSIGNEGYATIYVNGKKFRMYGEWYHITDDILNEPLNQIRVTLNSNDYFEYALKQRPIEAIGLIKNEGGSGWYKNKN